MPDTLGGDPVRATYKGFATAPPHEPAPAPPAGAARRPRRRIGASRTPVLLLAAACGVFAGMALYSLTEPGPAQVDVRTVPQAPSAGAPPIAPAALVVPTPPPLANQDAPATAVKLAPSPKLAKLEPRRDSCGARESPIARLTCRDPQVWGLDREMNATFAEAMRKSPAPGELAADQQTWIVRRDRVAREAPGALAALYRERLRELWLRDGG